MKVSVIDLGFNSIKLVSYDIKKDDSTFKVCQQEGVKVKLGEGLDRTGYLGKEPIERTIQALKRFQEIINFDGITQVLPVATSAVREASNRNDFLKQAYVEAGFQFKVLTEQEEAFYSYVGAIESTCIPTSLFFDLGGGSLEFVYAENYGIKGVKSYSLGALRLAQQFGRKDGTFSKKDYRIMREHIVDTLPNSKEFELSPDTTLVGVGGTLRAIARYDQQLRDYPLDKIHNYSIDYASLASIAEKLYEMDADQLAEIKAIGSNRTDTITAGATVIEMLMKKFDFNRIVVSAQGLREGILSAFIHDSKTFYNSSSSNNSLTNEKAKELLTFACRTEMLPIHTAELIKPIVAAGLLREKERMILAHAIKQKARLPSITNLNNLFYMIMDEDNAFLSHREQLLLALSIVRTRKEKAADWLFSRYKPMLEPQNKKSIEKISACIILSSLLEKTKAGVAMSINGKKIVMKITPMPSQFIPFLLYNNAINNFQRAFDVSIKYSIEQVKLPALTKESRGHDNEE